MSDASGVSEVPVAVARRVDQVCDEFETAWGAAASPDQRPRIEDYLVRLPETERSAPPQSVQGVWSGRHQETLIAVRDRPARNK
jgi:hypothetical protein